MNDTSNIICAICSNSMSEEQECIVLAQCSHSFHRNCMENLLTHSAECPTCKRPCELSELRSMPVSSQLTHSLQNESEKTIDATSHQHTKISKTAYRGKSRGAISKQYNSRSSKNLFQDQNQLIDWPSANNSGVGLLNEVHPSLIADARTDLRTQNKIYTPIRATNFDPMVLKQMIESAVTRILSNSNINKETPDNRNSTGDTNIIRPDTGDNVCNHGTSGSPRLSTQGGPPPMYNSNFAANPVSGSHEHFSLRADKITSIIRNWNLRFDGSAQGLSVDEFLYRVRSLTANNFDNDFSVICRNINILLAGKAQAWFWRYHKQVESVVWDDFCVAIRYQFKDFRTDFDIREELRSRKQKPAESFETFYESISSVLDRLSSPISEEDLIEIITRNLRPEIRHELLYVPILSIAHLRKLVQMRENLLCNDLLRSTYHRFSNATQRRNVAEVNFGGESELKLGEEDLSIEAVHLSRNTPKCWNCEGSGHFWEDCLGDRNIFCYGCGAKNTYKPDCVTCSSIRFSKNFHNPNLTKNQ
ncbi:uncharacterized protein LOC142227934 [Haematobia irritans]|uniref:uncharacterized protein LOC142227934 n=1 Tax=Haematobia irritans TaxID=7368 RepID=UPI003F500FF9